jgi:hypothetical protein
VAEVPDPAFDPSNNSLAVGRRFEFPDAPLAVGGARNVAAIPPDADGRHEHVTVSLDSGRLRVTAPRHGRAFTLAWDVEDFPHALIWQDYRAPDASFWGTCDAFAVEPQSAPGRSVADAVTAGAIRSLAPGSEVTVELRAAWEPL